jgi:RNA polymerase sigma factor (TIGR02999 family)
MSTDTRRTVTRLLNEGANGQADSLERLLPVVYRELHALASGRLRGERRNHTLQPTALVNEVYLRLVEQETPWQNRAHFFGVAAQAMRRIVIDYARTEQAAKRGGRPARVTLDDAMSVTDGPQLDALALDQALGRLEKLDPRAARIVELRFFAGLDVDETAEATGLSPATIKREWATARAWLKRELSAPPPSSSPA